MDLPQLPQADLTFHDVFDDEDNKDPQTVHHIRANSSIMQVKKILGESASARRQSTRSAAPVRGLRWIYLANVTVLHYSRQPRRNP